MRQRSFCEITRDVADVATPITKAASRSASFVAAWDISSRRSRSMARAAWLGRDRRTAMVALLQCFQHQRQVAFRNCKSRQIDWSGKRRLTNTPPKPTTKLRTAEPQRRLNASFEKLLALRWAGPRPAFQRCLDQIDAPHSGSLQSGSAKGNTKNGNCKNTRYVAWRGPCSSPCPPKYLAPPRHGAVRALVDGWRVVRQPRNVVGHRGKEGRRTASTIDHPPYRSGIAGEQAAALTLPGLGGSGPFATAQRGAVYSQCSLMPDLENVRFVWLKIRPLWTHRLRL